MGVRRKNKGLRLPLFQYNLTPVNQGKNCECVLYLGATYTRVNTVPSIVSRSVCRQAGVCGVHVYIYRLVCEAVPPGRGAGRVAGAAHHQLQQLALEPLPDRGQAPGLPTQALSGADG